jgi:hypothetical protein
MKLKFKSALLILFISPLTANAGPTAGSVPSASMEGCASNVTYTVRITPEEAQNLKIARTEETDALARCEYTQIMSELITAYSGVLDTCETLRSAKKRAEVHCAPNIDTLKMPEYQVTQKVFYTMYDFAFDDFHKCMSTNGGVTPTYATLSFPRSAIVAQCQAIKNDRPDYAGHGWVTEPVVATQPDANIHQVSAISIK